MKQKIKKGLLWLLGILVSIMLVILIAFNVSPRPGAFLIGHLFNGPVEMTDSAYFNQARKKVTVAKDQRYASKFEENSFDLYLPKKSTEKLPILIWVHGGGYVGGDKAGTAEFATRIAADAQIAVVSLNYQVAPDSHYPNQLHQVDELTKELIATDKYPQLDLQRLFYGGDSAGAQIALQYVTLQTNAAYAKQLDFTPQLKANAIRGSLSYCGPVNLKQITQEKSASRFMKFFVNTVGWSLIGQRDWKNSAELQEASLVNHLTADFPPTYLTDGNAFSFQEQGLAFQKKLTTLKVPVHSLFFNNSQKTINHEYQFDYQSVDAQKCYQQTLTFINQYK